jgi:uncharacterized membrane protein YqjE
MNEAGNAEPRWAEGPRRLLHGVTGLLSTRFELLVVEAQEEKHRAIVAVALATGAVALAGLGLALLTVALVMVCPPDQRLLLVTGLGVFYSAGAGILVLHLRRWLKTSPPPFEESRKQFEKDREWLNPQS